MLKLDLGCPQDARQFIADFDWSWAPAPPEYIQCNDGTRYEFATLTDADAIVVAHLLYDLVLEAKEQAEKNGMIQ